jgi:hypothetical protein
MIARFIGSKGCPDGSILRDLYCNQQLEISVNQPPSHREDAWMTQVR